MTRGIGHRSDADSHRKQLNGLFQQIRLGTTDGSDQYLILNSEFLSEENRSYRTAAAPRIRIQNSELSHWSDSLFSALIITDQPTFKSHRGRSFFLNFFRTTRFHHITVPVTNMAAGASPTRAQVNFVAWSQSPGPWQGIPIPLMRPKCK